MSASWRKAVGGKRIGISKALFCPGAGARKSDCVKGPVRSRRRITSTTRFSASSRHADAADGLSGLAARSTARRSRLSTRVPPTISRSADQNSSACGGGARAPNEAVRASSSPRSRRCARICSMSCGSSILAITRKRPPQRAHCSISTRRAGQHRRRAELVRGAETTRAGATVKAVAGLWHF